MMLKRLIPQYLSFHCKCQRSLGEFSPELAAECPARDRPGALTHKRQRAVPRPALDNPPAVYAQLQFKDLKDLKG